MMVATHKNLSPVHQLNGCRPSPSPHTLHWSHSALRVGYYRRHGFDPGGARLPALDDDVLNSRQLIFSPLGNMEASIIDECDRPAGGYNVSLLVPVSDGHQERVGGEIECDEQSYFEHNPPNSLSIHDG